LRRRRRQPTQIIKKKSFSSTSYPQIGATQQSKSNWKRFFSTFLFILIIAAISYFIYDITLNREVVRNNEQDTQYENPAQPVETEKPPPQPAEEAPFKKNVQVEILNGCGVNGVAKSFQEYLRAQGFDVVNTENYTENNKLRWDVQQSFVIDRAGNLEQAKAVARSLNINEEKVVSKNLPNPIYDVSVVIGKDFRRLNGSE
jgi:hypothetical protein